MPAAARATPAPRSIPVQQGATPPAVSRSDTRTRHPVPVATAHPTAQPMLYGLAGSQDVPRLLEFLARLEAPAHVLDRAHQDLPGRTLIVWTLGPSSRLLGAALVATRGRTATLYHLARAPDGPSRRDLADSVPSWSEPADGVYVLRATWDVPRRALGRRWHRGRHGYRYWFRPGDRPAPCAICRRPRVSRRNARQYPGLVCPECDVRAVDRRGRPPAVLDDHERCIVFIDGIRCTRYHLFGGWMTMRVHRR